jgi:hypothetical protein
MWVRTRTGVHVASVENCGSSLCKKVDVGLCGACAYTLNYLHRSWLWWYKTTGETMCMASYSSETLMKKVLYSFMWHTTVPTIYSRTVTIVFVSFWLLCLWYVLCVQYCIRNKHTAPSSCLYIICMCCCSFCCRSVHWESATDDNIKGGGWNRRELGSDPEIFLHSYFGTPFNC